MSLRRWLEVLDGWHHNTRLTRFPAVAHFLVAGAPSCAAFMQTGGGLAFKQVQWAPMHPMDHVCGLCRRGRRGHRTAVCSCRTCEEKR